MCRADYLTICIGDRISMEDGKSTSLKHLLHTLPLDKLELNALELPFTAYYWLLSAANPVQRIGSFKLHFILLPKKSAGRLWT